MPRRDDWIDDDEYPDARDMHDLGDDSPTDYDPLIVGRIEGVNTGLNGLSRSRIILIAFALILLIMLLVPVITQIVNR
ncbi:MAG: hypothetical protein KJ065_27395 [Anaerolineae bacterium]|nr:hypothetical protein [Anaerolineae bacterium]